MVHIVGAPSKDAQGARRVVHHSLGDGDFEHFLRIAREISCAQANLAPATATREIDRVLSEVREQKRTSKPSWPGVGKTSQRHWAPTMFWLTGRRHTVNSRKPWVLLRHTAIE